MSDPIYGIDLGTSNCLCAKATKLFDEVDIDCLMDDDGNISFPSVVHFSDREGVVIGKKAKNLLPDFPEKTIELVKLKLGKEKDIRIESEDQIDKLYSPQEITALLLRHFNLLHDNNIRNAILTVPAYFDDNQKAATLQAGELAGINIIELIEEPSAAIMYHLFEQYKNNKEKQLKPGEFKNYLVFDFGGGTLDLSFIKVELDEDQNIKPTVMIKEGDNELGGNIIDLEFTKLILGYLDEDEDDDFTNVVVEEFEYYYNHHHFRKGIEAHAKEFIMRLKNTLEHAKIELSLKDEVIIEFGNLEYENMTFTRDEFEDDILEEFFRDRVIDVLNRVKEKNTKNEKVHEVVLVGGTSQIPYFKKLISIHFPELQDHLVLSKDYDNAVAKGASILGAIKSGEDIPPFGKNRCYNIVSHNIFIGERKIIDYGVKFPFEVPIIVSGRISHALQPKLNIDINEEVETYDQTTKKRIKVMKPIKQLTFYHPFFYTRQRISIQIEINEHGIFYFTATHDDTNESIDFEAEKLFHLNEKAYEQARTTLENIKDLS
jgi:molecular chaperone DnaK (HSP70)